MERKLNINGIYTHYKSEDMKYMVIAEATNSETLEKLVIYKSLYDHGEYKKGTVWARPKEMFLEKLAEDLQEKYGKKYRFNEEKK